MLVSAVLVFFIEKPGQAYPYCRAWKRMVNVSGLCISIYLKNRINFPPPRIFLQTLYEYCRRGEFQLKPKVFTCIYKKKHREKEESFFFLRWDQANLDALFAARSVQREGWRTPLWRYSTEVITAPSWTPKELLFLLAIPFLDLDRGKESFKA
jgi:hypothetical protein